MINSIIELSLKYKFLTALFICLIIGTGFYYYKSMPVDAFPDVSPVMVPVFAEVDGMAAEEIERLVTYPIEAAMSGLPDVTQIKSTSAFGMAVIYIYFKDNVNIYFARQLVAERLAAAKSKLPALEKAPTLGPISSGLGQIFIYYLTIDDSVDTEGKEPLVYLRDLNDWIIKYRLQTVPGVTNVLSVGGHVLQYHINLNPHALRKYSLSLEDIEDAVKDNNKNVGGQYLVMNSEENLIRGISLLKDIDGLKNIPIKVVNGIPVKLSDVADVEYGPEVRRGVVTRNGGNEVVSGIVLKLLGENTSDVIENLYKQVKNVQKGLPEGVTITPYYEQSHLVKNATNTVKIALMQGIVLVFIVLFLFLKNLRAALIVAIAMPFCTAVALIGMNFMGISANLMSLGGIAIALGMLVDGSIVVVENITSKAIHPNYQTKFSDPAKLILECTEEVGRPITFALLIVIVVFLPLFSLEGVEGKMFKPMAFTISLALLGSIFAAICVAPVLSSILIKKDHISNEGFILVSVKKMYKSILILFLKIRIVVILITIAAVIGSVILLKRLGTEFVPTLEEGSIMIGVTMAPSISLKKAVKTITGVENKIMTFDGVKEVVSRIGRPEAGSHPHPVNYAEVHIELKPQSEWKKFRHKQELIAAIRQDIQLIPGIQINFTQPIQNAFDELLSGTKAQVAIKLFGEDLTVLKNKAEEICNVAKNVPGLVDVAAEQSFGQPQFQIIVDRKQAARYGIPANEVMELVEAAIGGKVIDYIYLNTRRYGIFIRYQDEYRSEPEALRKLLVHNNNGHDVTLEQVAEIKRVEGPVQINRENNQRRWTVQGNIEGRSLGHVIADLKNAIREKVTLPPGYFVDYGGQFENQQRAMMRLAVIVPIAIISIFILLWLTFNNARHAGIVMVNVPLALIGGVLGLYITQQYLSVPASVGFIALFGVAMQDAVVMVTDFNDFRENGHELFESIIHGSMLRFRPVVMTTLTTLLGLMPLLLSNGTGAEIQRPLAATVISGMISSTLLTLLVLPAVYYTVEKLFNKK